MEVRQIGPDAPVYVDFIPIGLLTVFFKPQHRDCTKCLAKKVFRLRSKRSVTNFSKRKFFDVKTLRWWGYTVVSWVFIFWTPSKNFGHRIPYEFLILKQKVATVRTHISVIIFSNPKCFDENSLVGS